MDLKFFACFGCGKHIHGNVNAIDDFSSNHICEHNGTEQENASKIINGVHGILTSLSAPVSAPTAIKSVNFLEKKYKRNEIYVSLFSNNFYIII